MHVSASLVCRGRPLLRFAGGAGRLRACIRHWISFINIGSLQKLYRRDNNFPSQAARRQSASLSLSPRLSNWNLSLQSVKSQGPSGYCTWGPSFSPRDTLSSLHNYSSLLHDFSIAGLSVSRQLKRRIRHAGVSFSLLASGRSCANPLQ